MELERPRKMELLYTPKAELANLMKENSLTIDELIFLFTSNKVGAIDIRTNAPTVCDQLLDAFLRKRTESENETQMTDEVEPVPA
jgi:hypothetical protein